MAVKVIKDIGAGLTADPRLAFIAGLRRKFPAGEWYLVGGAVRDLLLDRSVQDLDLVVRQINIEDLLAALSDLGAVDLVGKRFGVVKFRAAGSTAEIDIALPRTEKAGMSGGYRDFETQADSRLPLVKDLARRDFTVNAMAWDLGAGVLIDPFDGQADLAAKLIRAVGPAGTRFQEDYSRLLRAIRFACQLGFEIEARTWTALEQFVPHLNDRDSREERIVPYETIAKELVKAMAAAPVRAIELFERSGALFLLIPELRLLGRCEQSPDHHSEGDVWTHVKLALAALRSEAFTRLFPDEMVAVETVVAVLLHDIAKPATAGRSTDGRITFYGHDERGAILARRIVERLRLESVAGAGIDAARIEWLVRQHLFPNLVDLAAVRRTTLAKYFLHEDGRGRQLLHLAAADAAASLRPDGRADFANLERLLAALREMAAKKQPTAIISGEDVMAALELDSGPEVGRVLDLVHEAQFRGEVTTHEEAVAFLKTIQT